MNKLSGAITQLKVDGGTPYRPYQTGQSVVVSKDSVLYKIFSDYYPLAGYRAVVKNVDESVCYIKPYKYINEIKVSYYDIILPNYKHSNLYIPLESVLPGVAVRIFNELKLIKENTSKGVLLSDGTLLTNINIPVEVMLRPTESTSMRGFMK